MPVDLRISFRGIDPSPSVAAQVRRLVDELERIADQVSACRVVLEPAEGHGRHGGVHRVRVDLTAAGNRVVVNCAPAHGPGHEDMHACVRDAFDIMRRRLLERMRRVNARMTPRDSPIGAEV